MRSKISRKGDWIQKTIRLQPEAIQVYEYLQFVAVRDNIPKDTLFDLVINFSLEFLEKEKPFIKVSQYEPRRIVRGFTMQKTTHQRLENIYHFYKDRKELYKGEFVEACIYYFAQKKLSKEEIKQLKLKEWWVEFHERIKK